jgi:hypothetical protein
VTDLVAALDTAVAKLLAQAGLGPETPEKIEATPAERVKAFDSALEYAKIRPTLIVPEKKDSAFERIQRDFNGEKAERRGRPRKGKAETSPVIGDDDPVASAVNGIDLFDA